MTNTTFRKSFCVLVAGLALALPSVPVSAAELFAPGVTKDSGWYDTNKVFDSQDSNLCWAATAANVIAWWMDNYENGGGDLSKISDRSNNQIFQKFKENWNNVGYNNVDGVCWYFTGKFSTGTEPEELKNSSTGGYLSDIEGVGGRNPWNIMNGDFKYWGSEITGQTFVNDMSGSYFSDQPLYSYESFSQTILSQLSQGVSMLSVHKINTTVGSSGHSITLWGCEYDEETNLVTKIYVTDSDDASRSQGNDGLKEYRIIRATSGTGVMMSDYWYGNEQYGRITSSAMMYATYIPEPSAFGLIAGVMSIVSVVSRRRRK